MPKQEFGFLVATIVLIGVACFGSELILRILLFLCGVFCLGGPLAHIFLTEDERNKG